MILGNENICAVMAGTWSLSKFVISSIKFIRSVRDEYKGWLYKKSNIAFIKQNSYHFQSTLFEHIYIYASDSSIA